MGERSFGKVGVIDERSKRKLVKEMRILKKRKTVVKWKSHEVDDCLGHRATEFSSS